MASALRLRVLTPADVLLEAGKVEWAHVRLANGTGISIYPAHAPLLAETVTAPVRYRDSSGEHSVNVEAGILQVRDGEVMIFTRTTLEGVEAQEPPAVEEARKFERLARELRQRLEGEPDSILENGGNEG